MQLNLRPRRRPVPAIPIVSLIDIMVILLIFFIATTTFRDKKVQMKINLPQSQTMGGTEAAETTRKTITVTPNKELFLDGNPVNVDKLAAELKSLKAANPNTKLELQADTDTSLGMLVKIWDALRASGFSINDVPARIQRPGQN
ncbi:MAG: biopolymer transporter ExbD [Verrucomicrobiota bacterium]